MRTVTLYTRANCKLCEEAEHEIDLARQEIPLRFERIDIDVDPTRLADYTDHVPVVHLDGVEIFRHRLTASALLEKLKETH